MLPRAGKDSHRIKSRSRRRRTGDRAVSRRAQRPQQRSCGRRSTGTAGDDRSWRPDRLRRVLPEARPRAVERPSAPWRARCWPCSRRWPASRNGVDTPAIAILPGGLGHRHSQMTAWLDDNCGAEGWAMVAARGYTAVGRLVWLNAAYCVPRSRCSSPLACCRQRPPQPR
jgi:hypothetical protein